MMKILRKLTQSCSKETRLHRTFISRFSLRANLINSSNVHYVERIIENVVNLIFQKLKDQAQLTLISLIPLFHPMNQLFECISLKAMINSNLSHWTLQRSLESAKHIGRQMRLVWKIVYMHFPLKNSCMETISGIATNARIM